MDGEKFISVVVPVYNVEQYVETCIKSIQAQTFSNIEIILIDDGSSDSSGIICDEFAEEDDRIIVIHKENGGLSDARNAGLSIARGEYICFIDSDDWIEPETLNYAIKSIVDVDVVIWGYYKDTVDIDGNLLDRTIHCFDAVCNHIYGYNHLLKINVLQQAGYAWNKLYKTSEIRRREMHFEKGLSLVEDVVFNFQLFIQCKEIRFIDYLGSHYMQRPRNTLGSAYYPNRLELKLRVAELTKQLLKSYGAPEEIAMNHYMQNISTMLRSSIRLIASEKCKYSVRRQSMKELLYSDKCKEIVSIARPRDLKNRIVILAARLHLVDLLILIGRR